MVSKTVVLFVFLAVIFATGDGFGLRDVVDYLIGGGSYGHYPNYPGNGNYQQGPGNYPQGPGNYPQGSGNYPQGPVNFPSGPGLYPGGQGNYPGSNYPGPGVVGPPGAHPGCPLCDSSVYSYCSHKQAHDACCCEHNPQYLPYNCRKYNCNSLYANSCQEYNLISSCCCVDVQKSAGAAIPVPVLPVPVVG